MKGNKVLNLSKEYAVLVIEVIKKLSKKESNMSNQLIRSATSIGANIHESVYAQGKADFLSKLKIALKECHESEYWLELLYKSQSINESDYTHLKNKCGTIRRILIASCNTIKNNKES